MGNGNRPVRREREEAGEGVSKLVMKSSSGGGRGSTRRRALIHSIPKFSQVRPTHQLTTRRWPRTTRSTPPTSSSPPPQEAGGKQRFDPKRRPNASLNNNNNAGVDLKEDATSANGSPIASRQEESLCKSKSVEMMLVASQEKKTETGATFCKFKSVKTGSIKNSNIEPQPSS